MQYVATSVKKEMQKLVLLKYILCYSLHLSKISQHNRLIVLYTITVDEMIRPTYCKHILKASYEIRLESKEKYIIQIHFPIETEVAS